MRIAIFCLLLSGCTINIVDKRLTREEVGAALKQRDEAIGVMAKAIKELQPKDKKPLPNAK